jgi:hypothetical protein
VRVSEGEQTQARKLVEVAAECAPLLLHTKDWIHRRVYQIGFTSSGMRRTRISIDFTLDGRFAPFQGDGGPDSVFYVPLLMLRKWPPLLRLDLLAPDRSSIPLLTSRKNREIDGAVLLALAPDGDLKDAVRGTLEEIALEDKLRATELAETLGHLVVNASGEDLPPEAREAWLQTLLVASSLASNSFLWARVTGAWGDRIVVKVAFEDRTLRKLVLWRELAAALNWAPVRLVSTFPNAGDGSSFHVQIDPPEEMRIHRARLLPQDPFPATPAKPPAKLGKAERARQLYWGLQNTLRWRRHELFGAGPEDPQSDRLQPEEHRPPDGKAYRWETPERAYLYVAGEREQAAVAEVDFTVHERHGLETAALGIAVAIAALLSYFAAAAGEVAAHEGAAVTVLVLVPAVLSYLLVRQQEHPILRKMLWGVRLLVLLSGMLPVLAAAVLLGFAKPTGAAVCGWWIACAAAAWAIVGLLALSWLLPMVKDPYPAPGEEFLPDWDVRRYG